ncbi:MAG: DUF2335 domain-containing protein [Terracidiphilus sp.]
MTNRSGNHPPTPPPTSTAITTLTQSVSFSGPLPHPNLLAKYNEVIPDGANRIMAMAERQSAHRESLEAKVVAGNVASQARGSHYAFIICLVTIVGGFVLIETGKSIYGISAIILSLATLAGVFVIAKKEQKKERVEKSTALEKRGRA